MLSSTTTLYGNRLLTSLPRECQAVIAGYLELVTVRAGQVLCGYNHKLHHVYFPTNSILCFTSLLENGGVLDVTEIGPEGTTGALAATGKFASPYAHSVQASGYAYRMSIQYFNLLVENSPDFRKAILLYLSYLYVQTAQNSVCIKHHNIRARICRWLMTHADMLGNNTVIVTQQQMADSLGCRRESVTEVMTALTERGEVTHTRGSIEIRDWQAMRGQACVCYPILRTALNDIFPQQYKEEALY
jgi:CRP-like cAMP-binding protein